MDVKNIQKMKLSTVLPALLVGAFVVPVVVGTGAFTLSDTSAATK